MIIITIKEKKKRLKVKSHSANAWMNGWTGIEVDDDGEVDRWRSRRRERKARSCYAVAHRHVKSPCNTTLYKYPLFYTHGLQHADSIAYADKPKKDRTSCLRK
jgi:hypothetical protein